MTKDFRYLTFDCYGTLIDWQKGIEDSLKRELGEKLSLSGKELLEIYTSIEAEEEEVAEGGGQDSYKKYRDVLRNSFLRLAEDEGIRVRDSAGVRFAGSVPSWPAFQDTKRSLKSFGRLGYKRFILSNVDNDIIEQTISAHELSVDGFVTAEDVKSYKPAIKHWLRFMERTQSKKEEILHVAQSIFHDIIPAARLGIASAWINRYDQPVPENVGPLFICNSLDDLVSLLR